VSSSLHYVARGSGPTLLCLHGIGSSSESFAAQLAGLAGTHRVVAWDAPGYGKSADPDEAPGLAGYVTAVTELIAELGEPVHLLGVSWGGVIAAETARTQPQLLRSLILIGASRGSGRSPGPRAAMLARAAELAGQPAEAYARARAPRLVSPAADQALIARVTDIMAAAIRLPGYGYAAQAMAAADITDGLGEIAVPALVMAGIADTVTGPAESWELASRIPGAAYVPVPGAGHLANQEQPEFVNAWLTAHIQIVERNNNRTVGEESS
jgi:pimeloyl-ACP methyl ester carboxylesterase